MYHEDISIYTASYSVVSDRVDVQRKERKLSQKSPITKDKLNERKKQIK